jgi:glycosyltransferase involved in cell wall biosynthesis
MFEQVFALSPVEAGQRFAYGMTIRGVREKDFLETLKAIRPDVVRAYGGFWPADLACRYRLPNVPVIVSVHDTNPRLLHKSVRYADLVICTSNAVKRQVIASGTDEHKTRILPNRVDTEVFHPIKDRELLAFLDRRFPPGIHILHVGRKAHMKNLDTLVCALQYLPDEYSCIFVGSGDAIPYRRLAKERGVASRCYWIESVKNRELPYWYSWCDCMCTPSRWEGFGIVFIEAAACGAAIVTSDIGPMNEYLSHNESACLVPDYENPKSLSEAIRKSCEDSNYRDLISRGAVLAAQPFERRKVDAAEVSIYREALMLQPYRLSLFDKMNLSLSATKHRATHLWSRLFKHGGGPFARTRRQFH